MLALLLPPGGHAAKAAKGLLARALLVSADVDETLATFDPAPLHLSVEEATTRDA